MRLTDHLASLEPAMRRRLFTDRGLLPDPKEPLSTTANRLAQDQSISAAMELLDQFQLVVLAGIATLTPTTAREITGAVLRPPALTGSRRPTAQDVDGALGRLSDLALVWRDADGALHHPARLPLALCGITGVGPSVLTLPAPVVTVAAQAWGERGPAALVGALQDPDRVNAFLASLTKNARGLLVRALEGLVEEPTWSPPARALLARGLLVPVGSALVIAPRELLDRESLLHGLPPVSPEQPLPVGRPTTAAAVDAAGVQALTRLRDGAVQVVALAERDGIPTLQDGQVGVREQKRLAKLLGWPQEDVHWLLETLADAKLVLGSWSTPVRATGPGRTFLVQDPARQWATLLAAGLAARGPRWTPDLSRPADVSGHRWDPDAGWRPVRPALLRSLAGLPPGTACTLAEILTVVSWQHPLGRGVELQEAGLAELGLLGLLAGGAVTALGRLVHEGADPEPLLQACAPALETTARFQNDLTATVLGTPAGALVQTLDGVGVRESSGPATVWRLDAETLRGQLDAGRTAAQVLAALQQVSSGPLPPAVERLVDDTARTHGRVKVASVAVVVLLEDAAAAELVLRTKGLGRLGLRRLGTDTLVSHASAAVTLNALRKAGLAPVVLDLAPDD